MQNMRSVFWAGLVVCGLSLHGTHPAAQQSEGDQRPSFRSGVELVTVEVGVHDKQGRPLPGLGPADFIVTVGGQPRRVVTAEFIDVAAHSVSAGRPEAVPVSTNEGAGVGRLIVFVVDNNTLEPGDARNVANAASRFLSRLGFADRSALVTLPVGPGVAFTWAHDRVGDALLRSATGGGHDTGWEYGSLTEARDIATRGSFALNEVALRECSSSILASGSGFGGRSPGPSAPDPGQSSPPAGGSSSGSGGSGSQSGSSGAPRSPSPQGSSSPGLSSDRCLREIQTQAEMAWAMARANSLSSVTALQGLLSTLARIHADKAVVLISGGWPLDDADQASILNSLASDAAAARVTLFSLFVPRHAMSASRRFIGSTIRSDESLYQWTLENLASVTGGRAFRADASPEGVFDRLSRELAGYYRIGVEKSAMDTGAKGRRMKVQVARSGLSVRAREIFDTTTYEDRDWSARLGSALESPLPATAVGLRLTSYLAADPADPASMRLVLAGDASRLQPGDATLQLIVWDLTGRRVVAGTQRITISEQSPAPFATHVAVPPGSYMVRLAVQDVAGRVGSVDHRVEARPVSIGAFSVTGPMLVQVSGQGEPHFAVDGVRPDERLALEVGLQGDSAHLASADVVFEIAENADGPPLIQQPATFSAGGRDRSMLAHAMADVRVLPPGQYVARVKVKSAEGGDPLGEVRRAFAVFERPTRPVLEAEAGAVSVAPRSGLPAASIRGRAAAAVPRFAVQHVLAPDVLGAFLERVAARPDAAAPAADDLLSRARTGDIARLNVSDAQAAQTPIAAFLKGLALLAQNKLDPAGSAFRSAMRASPDFYPAMVYLGACYAAAGNDKEAAAIWRTALIKEGDALTLHLLLADALLRQGNGDLALQVVNAARARWPDQDELHRRFVLAAMLAGNVAAGLEVLDNLVERRAEDEPSLALALLVLYEALSNGRPVESEDEDRARLMHLADAYRARGGPSLALVEAWVAAAKRR